MSARALLLLLALPCALTAQVRPPTRARVDTIPRRDTLARPDSLAGRDSLRAGRAGAQQDSVLVRWAPPDSVMQALMALPSYTVTRYQGSTVIFDASQRAFEIQAGDTVSAVVQRDARTVVTDSLIVYEETNRNVTVRGKRIVLSDPSSGQADVVSSGTVQYNLATGSALITNPRFPVEDGAEQWYVTVDKARMVRVPSDTGRAGQIFYGSGGTITSCEDSIPDYYFLTKEIKKTAGNTLVARPAILYIKDIPVMWLPFIFKDTRSGRRSGVLTPQFGVADIVRNSPNYRRHVQDIGYYFAINEYMDARLSLDWLSNAGSEPGELPGYMTLKGEWRYTWLERYLHGFLATDYDRYRDGRTNLAITMNHSQDFSRRSRLSTDLNYVTSTTLQRQSALNPWAQTSTIRSTVNYSYDLGPARLQLGGTRTQYPGRDQILQTLPTLTLTTGPLSLGSWLVWTPNLSYRLEQKLRSDEPGVLAFRYTRTPGGELDSVQVKKNSSNASLSFDTPLRIFGYDLRNSFSVQDQRLDYPQPYPIVDVVTGENVETRILPRSYSTSIDWTPSFELPPFLRSFLNVSPSVSLQNVMQGAFWVRSPLTNGQFVHQSKRPTFSLSASPAIYGFFPGFGPFERLRHSFQPQIGFSYSPAANLDTAFLRALNQSVAGNRLAALRRSSLSFGLTQNIEAKVRARGDSAAAPEGGNKIKLLSLQFSPLSYNFERAKETGKAIRGLETDRFTYSLSSDLLPNFSLSLGYSLFQGTVNSDTAVFKPYRESVSARLSLSRESNPFMVLNRLFGRAAQPSQPGTAQGAAGTDAQLTRQLANEPVAGSRRSGRQFAVPPAEGWSLDLSFSANRPRPPVGGNIVDFDPTAICQVYRDINPVVYQQCIAREQISPTSDDPTTSPISGAPPVRIPATASIQGSTRFQITTNWAASWSTSYDMERHEFAAHQVSLQRNLHDWRAIFAFTQAPNGSFAFSFNIALKAQPDLKFDYNKATYRTGESF